MTRYLEEDSLDKRSHADDISNARILRWPAWDQDAMTWRYIERAPLDPAPGELSVSAILELWVRDQQRILRRSRINSRHYQLRPGAGDAPVWYHQPEAGHTPEPRRPVTDPALIHRLDSSNAAGPVAGSTLRTRQSLVARVLKLAWRPWDWAADDQSGRILYRRAAPARTQLIDKDQLTALLIHAEPHFADLILGAAWTGLRRANLIDLTWDRVVFTASDAGGRILQRGHYSIPAEHVKNNQALWQPLSERLEQLLQERRRCRQGPFVFHQGDGSPWKDYRKRWATAKRRAGVPTEIHWHDLRATWATGYASQLNTAQLQALGGWKDSASAERYIRLQHNSLNELVEKHD